MSGPIASGPSRTPAYREPATLLDLCGRFSAHEPCEDSSVLAWLLGWPVRLAQASGELAIGTTGRLGYGTYPMPSLYNHAVEIPVEVEDRAMGVPYGCLEFWMPAPANPVDAPLEAMSWNLRRGNLRAVVAVATASLPIEQQATARALRAGALMHLGSLAEAWAELEPIVDLPENGFALIAGGLTRVDILRHAGEPDRGREVALGLQRCGTSLEAFWRVQFEIREAQCLHALEPGNARATRLIEGAVPVVAHDPFVRGEAQQHLALIAMAQGLHDRARDLLLSALVSFKNSRSLIGCGQAHGNLMNLADRTAPRRQATVVAHAAAGAACFRYAGSLRDLARCLQPLAMADPDRQRSVAQAREITHIARQVEPRMLSEALQLEAQSLATARRLDEAAAAYEEAAPLLREEGEVAALAEVQAHRAVLAVGSGELGLADRLVLEARRLRQEAGQSEPSDALERAERATIWARRYPGNVTRTLLEVESVPLAGLASVECPLINTVLIGLAHDMASSLLRTVRQREDCDDEVNHVVGPALARRMIRGSQVYHMLVRRERPSPACGQPLDETLTEHWFGAVEVPGREEHMIFEAVSAVAQQAGAAPVLEALGEDATLRFIRNFDLPAAAAGAIRAVINGAIEAGYKLEFVADHALAEQRLLEHGRRFREELANGGRSIPDIVAELGTVARELLPDLRPWPRSRRCRCGADLRPYMFCCDPANPIDLTAWEGHLGPGFVLERECCGATLTGFTCDSCQQIYSWDLGVDEGA